MNYFHDGVGKGNYVGTVRKLLLNLIARGSMGGRKPEGKKKNCWYRKTIKRKTGNFAERVWVTYQTLIAREQKSPQRGRKEKRD